MKDVTVQGDAIVEDPHNQEVSPDENLPVDRNNQASHDLRAVESHKNILMSEVEPKESRGTKIKVDDNMESSTVTKSFKTYFKSRQHRETPNFPPHIFYLNVISVRERNSILSLSNLDNNKLYVPALESELQANMDKSKTYKKNSANVRLIPSQILEMTWLIILNDEGLLFGGELISVGFFKIP